MHEESPHPAPVLPLGYYTNGSDPWPAIVRFVSWIGIAYAMIEVLLQCTRLWVETAHVFGWVRPMCFPEVAAASILAAGCFLCLYHRTPGPAIVRWATPVVWMATFSIRHGLLFAEFSRESGSLKDAILSAIKDVRRAKIGAVVHRIDDSDLLTPSEIARKIKRSRQMVHKYMTGQRGPGSFPPPACHIADDAPLWSWSQVSEWLARHNIIRPEERWNAQVIAIINNSLEAQRQRSAATELFDELTASVSPKRFAVKKRRKARA